MTQEEMERAFNFIVEQQAQFSADIQQLKESQTEFQKILAEHQKIQAEHQRKLDQLTDATIALTTIVGQLAKTHAEADDRLNKQLAETDERLNIFINVVERFISDRNGNSKDQQS